MRLVAERAQDHAGQQRPCRQQQHSPGEQRARQEGVLPECRIFQQRRKRQQRQQAEPRRPTPAAQVQHAPQRGQQKGERRGLEDDEGGQIGQAGQQRADRQEHRRVVEHRMDDAGAARALLGRPVRRPVVGECGRAGIGQRAGGVEADEIRGRRARRLADQPMRESGDEQEHHKLAGQQRAAPDDAAVARQPSVPRRPEACSPDRPARPHRAPLDRTR
jgi:hypothetical protein